MSFDEGFAVYLKISPEQTGIDDAVFFPDLLDFLIWEDYGSDRRRNRGLLPAAERGSGRPMR